MRQGQKGRKTQPGQSGQSGRSGQPGQPGQDSRRIAGQSPCGGSASAGRFRFSALMGLMAVATLYPSLAAAQSDQSEPLREPGLAEQPPIEKVTARLGNSLEPFELVRSFLLIAHGEYQTTRWATFCAEWGLDASWPSAHRLGRLYGEVQTEWEARLDEAVDGPDFVSNDGTEPNLWKVEALGRAFGELAHELEQDGYSLSLVALLRAIDGSRRSSLAVYSTESDPELLERKRRLFWRAVAESVELPPSVELPQSVEHPGSREGGR